MKTEKLVGASTVIFVFLSVLVVILDPILPELGASGEKIVEYYRSEGARFLFSNYAGALALVFIIPLEALIVQRVRAKEPNGLNWITVALSSAIVDVYAIIDLGFFQTASYIAQRGEAQTARALSDLAWMQFGFFMVSQLAFMGFVGWALLKTRVMPRWIGSTALIVAAASGFATMGTFIPSIPLLQPVVAAFGALMLWATAVSAYLLLA